MSRSPVREAIRTLEQEGLLLIDDKSKLQFMNRQSKILKKYTNAVRRSNPWPFLWRLALPLMKHWSSFPKRSLRRISTRKPRSGVG
ncbi:GntR family transcriptional regulator [Bacillus licheniformis]|nr:GntR family transcriptional regulator [Bacillus licheniformis]